MGRKRSFTKSQKLDYINSWKESGLSRSDFSRRNKLSPSAFSNWLKKFDSESIPLPNTSQLHFIEVTPKVTNEKSKIAKHPTVVITTASGSRMEFYL